MNRITIDLPDDITVATAIPMSRVTLGYSACGDAYIIDTGYMNHVEYDGKEWRDVDEGWSV